MDGHILLTEPQHRGAVADQVPAHVIRIWKVSLAVAVEEHHQRILLRRIVVGGQAVVVIEGQTHRGVFHNAVHEMIDSPVYHGWTSKRQLFGAGLGQEHTVRGIDVCADIYLRGLVGIGHHPAQMRDLRSPVKLGSTMTTRYLPGPSGRSLSRSI